MTSILHAHHLKKNYGKKPIVKDITLSLHSGEIVGLLGPNGAGKTTSFYLLAGLISPDSGSIKLNQHELTPLTLVARAHYGIRYLPQESSVFRRLSVQDNILSILELRSDLTKAEQHIECERLMDEFQLQSVAHNLGEHLSGGERRRVEIARILASNPSMILLDEPFAGIDPISVLELQQILKQLAKKNIGILITDHNVREALHLCNRAYIVNQGEILYSGTPEEIIAHPVVRDVYLGSDFSL